MDRGPGSDRGGEGSDFGRERSAAAGNVEKEKDPPGGEPIRRTRGAWPLVGFGARPQGLALDLKGRRAQRPERGKAPLIFPHVPMWQSFAPPKLPTAQLRTARQRWRRAAGRLRKRRALDVSVRCHSPREREVSGTSRALRFGKPVRISPPVWKPGGFQTMRNRAVRMGWRRERLPRWDALG